MKMKNPRIKGLNQGNWARNLVLQIIAVLAVVALSPMFAAARDKHDGHSDRDSYAIGLWGDLPYSTVQATVGVPNLIADMNAQTLAFTVHDGDLKSGSSDCTNAVYTQALAYLNSLKAPAAFTPGDNDWTDCDRNPAFSSLERLDYERHVLFGT